MITLKMRYKTPNTKLYSRLSSGLKIIFHNGCTKRVRHNVSIHSAASSCLCVCLKLTLLYLSVFEANITVFECV